MSKSDSEPTTPQQQSTVDSVIEAFRAGNPVAIHDADDREGETDLVFPAGSVTPADVSRMRNDAGGLVCVALSDEAADGVDLPFVQDVVDHPAASDHDLEYDDRSSFSLTVNHRDTFTGITDVDRARTISELAPAATAAVAGEYDAEDFAAEFRAPGHVHLLRAAPDLLEDRLGHTELGIALAEAADLPPAVVVCEMLDDESGGARSKDAAADYADRHGIPYVEGWNLVDRLG